MYFRYFGLQEEPFSIAVNPKYLFMSARHRDALAHLLYGVGAGGGFILLTGEVGTGKTTINRALLQQLPAETDIAIILNPALNADELLATACDELGITYEAGASLKDLTDCLHAFLLENHSRGRNTVLLIDEAQHLQFDVLEQIRLLTNLETNTRKLLQIILVGQPELSAMLAKPELRQLSQRITARYNLQPLNLDETDAYIRHRLQVAGLPANQEIFPPGVVKGIYRESRGIPRIINVLCDRMLLGTYGQNKSRVDRAMLKQAAAEVMGEQGLEPQSSTARWVAVAAVLVLCLGFLLFSVTRDGTEAVQDVAKTLEPPISKPEPVTSDSLAGEWIPNRVEAELALADYLGLSVLPGRSPCDVVEVQGWRCETLRAQSWNELLDLNRPAILSLVTTGRFSVNTVLVGVEAGRGRLLSGSGEFSAALADLGPLWQGEYTIMWQPPIAYTAPVAQGDRGEFISWLAEEFAALDGQDRPLAVGEFNAALDTRVRMFQERHGLLSDGVVGMKTLLKLEAARDPATPQLRGGHRLAGLESI